MAGEEKNIQIQVIIERLSQNINMLVQSLQELKDTTGKLSDQIQNFEVYHSKLNVEKRLNDLEEWEKKVNEVWNIEGMKETKRKSEEAKVLSIRIATIYGAVMFLIAAGGLIVKAIN